MGKTRFCPACGHPGEHPRCPDRRPLDPPRHCSRCGGRLDVQVLPEGLRATCRACDGVHPARPGPER